MRELTYLVATTLDGRIAAPDGSFDFFPVDSAYAAALAQRWGDALPTAFHQAFATTPAGTVFDTVVMGRASFEPAMTAGIPDPYAHLETYVYSSTLDQGEHPGVTVVGGDALAHVRALKAAEGGGIWLCGGGRLAAAIIEEVDRLVLKLSPVTTGAGRALLDGAFDPRAWSLQSTETFEAGVVVLDYRRTP